MRKEIQRKMIKNLLVILSRINQLKKSGTNKYIIIEKERTDIECVADVLF
ncbi:hypothetical protein H312_01385 [Anncaliia algerae PRA339]|uniref:Uncharacterized protein n=1 Tax=Anncaliia algerae PRA339 TaxID=1288291 RepID=A0A059F1W9_9MICR|nr:hypothetical protein H312_01385 [Anncaliia algerae PRA339]